MGKGTIKVLVVDDSLVFREALSKGIAKDPEIMVVAKASDAYEARDKIIEFAPDVMTCDVEMPRMDGIDFIRRLLPQYAIPVLVVSSVSERVLEALEAGAVDFVAKPDMGNGHNRETFIAELIYKIKIAAKVRVVNPGRIAAQQVLKNKQSAGADKIIAIGASTGGTEAIYSVLKSLPPDVPGTVIVQHIPPYFSGMFAQRLNHQTSLSVKEAETGDYLERGKVLIAPGDKHMIIKKAGNRFRVECFSGEKVNGHCPSVDVLFQSVAKEAGNRAVGVILTGMGNDGAKGLLAMRVAGAQTLGQNEKSSVVYGMPKAAYELGAVERQVSLDMIPSAIFSLLK